MARVLDKNYFPMPFPGGSSLVSTTESGEDTIEVTEFYDANGKVIFYWKVKKNSSGEVIDFRLKSAGKTPAEPAVAYKDYDNLA